MFVLVNLKAYDCDVLQVAQAAHAVSDTSGVRIGVAPQAVQLNEVAQIRVETWAQHVDPVEYGKHTGSTAIPAVVETGVSGTILNHSERRLRLADISAAVSLADEYGLETVVCANDADQVAAATALGPDAVAVEPPELIGTGTPVSRADPDIVRDAVEAAAAIDDSVAVLCGAGISTGEDVAAARELGAEGVLLASGVAKADDPEKVLTDLVEPVSV